MDNSQRFGRLVIIEYINSKTVHVKCDCGTEKTVQYGHLMRGVTTSCGCLRAEMLSERRSTHKRTDSREYRAWCNMKARCYTPGTIGFARWGGRGITVCDRWKNSFENFLADMGECPKGFTLERVSVDGNYEPANCKWASFKEQQNNKSDNVLIDYDGRRQTIAMWADEIGLRYHTLYRRVVIKGESPPHAFRSVNE